MVKLQNFVRENDIATYSHRDDAFIDVEIKSITYHDPSQGFIARTDEQGLCDMKFSFNVSHVSSIVKRGTGKVTLDFVRYDLDSSGNIFIPEGMARSKNRYYWNHMYSSPVMKFIDSLNLPIDAVIHEMFFRRLESQTFMEKINRLSGSKYVSHFTLFSADKKKVKRWIKQNINRYLERKKTVIERTERDLDKIYNSDFDRHLDVLDDMFEEQTEQDKDVSYLINCHNQNKDYMSDNNAHVSQRDDVVPVPRVRKQSTHQVYHDGRVDQNDYDGFSEVE